MVASKKPQQRTTVCRRRRRHHPRPFSRPRARTTGITWPPAAVEADRRERDRDGPTKTAAVRWWALSGRERCRRRHNTLSLLRSFHTFQQQRTCGGEEEDEVCAHGWGWRESQRKGKRGKGGGGEAPNEASCSLRKGHLTVQYLEEDGGAAKEGNGGEGGLPFLPLSFLDSGPSSVGTAAEQRKRGAEERGRGRPQKLFVLPPPPSLSLLPPGAKARDRPREPRGEGAAPSSTQSLSSFRSF